VLGEGFVMILPAMLGWLFFFIGMALMVVGCDFAFGGF
jgi:hypothetical protein